MRQTRREIERGFYEQSNTYGAFDENATAVARYTLAVDRRFNRNNDEQTADFINCVAFGRSGEFAEKYFHKGTKIAITGRIQTGSYTNKDGVRVYTTDIVVEDQEFAESKNSAGNGDGGFAPSGRPEPAAAGECAEEKKFVCSAARTM